jgi:hypothetical protein
VPESERAEAHERHPALLQQGTAAEEQPTGGQAQPLPLLALHLPQQTRGRQRQEERGEGAGEAERVPVDGQQPANERNAGRTHQPQVGVQDAQGQLRQSGKREEGGSAPLAGLEESRGGGAGTEGEGGRTASEECRHAGAGDRQDQEGVLAGAGDGKVQDQEVGGNLAGKGYACR